MRGTIPLGKTILHTFFIRNSIFDVNPPIVTGFNKNSRTFFTHSLK